MELGLLAGVIILLVVMFLEGYRKGIIRIVLAIATTVVSFILAFVLAGPFETYLKNNTKVYDKVNHQIEEYVDKHISEEINKAGSDKQNDSVKELKLPKSIQDKLINDNTVEEKLKLGTGSFTDYISKSLTDILIHSMAIIILFVILKVMLRIVVELLDIISRLPLIKDVNKTLGGVVGLAEGVLILWLICILITAMSGTSIGQDIFSAISSNKILSFIYNSNILMNLMI